MLVFQIDGEHIEDRCERVGIKDPKWLYKVVTEINNYLPKDWRLTRTENNFRIQVVAEHMAALVGFCYRCTDDEIIQIIDTILIKHYFDKIDAKVILNDPQKKITREDEKENPELFTPNLYFFYPCPDDSTSPLFARQYEKIKRGKDGEKVDDQFHRIHPLTKAGLDIEHFRWVHWAINGDVKFVDAVDPTYHGKDYWEIPLLKDTLERGGREYYIDQYWKTLNKAQIVAPQQAERAPSPYEIEYKFLIPGSEEDAYALFSLIEEEFSQDNVAIEGFKIYNPIDKKAKNQVDSYFDDENLTLHAMGASFRLRRKKENLCVTLKKRLPLAKKHTDEGLYERIEEVSVITPSQAKSLSLGEPINVLPYRLIFYMAPGCGKLRQKLKVINARKIINLEDPNHRKAELCLDKVIYKINRKKYGPYFEIEIESKGAPREKIRDLADFMEASFGLIVSRQSKYERGISLIKTLEVPKEKKSVIIDTDCGVDDALALILALKSPELDVKAITTVAGNVHLDKVIPNVFKVLNALNLQSPPPVAKGEDRPIKKEPIIADSVHGEDGLGDFISIFSGAVEKNTPAWKVICNLACQYPKQITLITIGPLTNLALAIQNDPDSVLFLKEIVAMGGVFFDIGNVNPDAEFNVAADPDAAHEVVKFCRNSCLKTPIDSKGEKVILPQKPTKEDYKRIVAYQDLTPPEKRVPLIFVGLDVTHKVLLRRAALERAIKSHPGNRLLKFIKGISEKYMDFYRENEGLPGCYLHDPLAVAYVINPVFLEIKRHIIRVETRGQFTNGMIFPDDRPTRNPEWRNPAEEVIGVARNVEREAFEEFFLTRLVDG